MSEGKIVNESKLCPVHGMPDCSPLLNGCSRLTADEAGFAFKAKMSAQAMEDAEMGAHLWPLVEQNLRDSINAYPGGCRFPPMQRAVDGRKPVPGTLTYPHTHTRLRFEL